MIRALYYSDRKQHHLDRIPGSLWISDDPDQKADALWFFCPCGCGLLSRLTIGRGFKPDCLEASWSWNGSTSEPSLSPSVNILSHWHGWLKHGYWEAC